MKAYLKLKQPQLERWWRLLTARKNGATYAALARQEGVSETCIRAICQRAEYRMNHGQWVTLMSGRAFAGIMDFMDRHGSIITAQQVVDAINNATDDDLLSTRGLGRSSLNELRRWAAYHGSRP